jgi:TonB-dependent SusC/RagA subfamily outer membrane receptor
MASLTPRVALSCALLVGLLSGCASNNAARPDGTDKPAPLPNPPVGSTITADDLDRAGGDAIEKTLAAKVPGALITRTADGGIAIQIRGQTSLAANTQPLYVIDGLPIEPGPGGALVGINPHDIATIEVLKDAASLSYYGLRGANGVIIIKTKRTTN